MSWVFLLLFPEWVLGFPHLVTFRRDTFLQLARSRLPPLPPPRFPVSPVLSPVVTLAAVAVRHPQVLLVGPLLPKHSILHFSVALPFLTISSSPQSHGSQQREFVTSSPPLLPCSKALKYLLN